MSSAIASASSRSVVAAPCGCAIDSDRIRDSNARRSSARSMLAILLPRMVDARAVQWLGEVDRGLTTELHDDPGRLLLVDDRGNRLLVERLEVQARAAVEVRAHRLRVAVDHHRVDALRAQRHGGVHAAVVELDALADADRTAAEHHDSVRRERSGCGPLVLGLVASSSSRASPPRTPRRTCRRT